MKLSKNSLLLSKQHKPQQVQACSIDQYINNTTNNSPKMQYKQVLAILAFCGAISAMPLSGKYLPKIYKQQYADEIRSIK